MKVPVREVVTWDGVDGRDILVVTGKTGMLRDSIYRSRAEELNQLMFTGMSPRSSG